MVLSDTEVFVGSEEKDLPPAETMEAAARALAERLTRLAAAPKAEEYRGPVLFEGPAAAEFFHQTLAPSLGNSHEPVGGSERMSGLAGNPLREKIGQKVLSSFLTVVDDPTAKEAMGVRLLGGYEVDDDGVRARKVSLVEKGILKTFCMSRIPTRKIKASNGHSRRGVGAPSLLFVQAESPVPLAELRKKLVELGKEEGLTHVLVARRLSNAVAGILDPGSFASSYMSRMDGGGGISLLPPVLLYRVSVEDGKEELLRGARFGRLTPRVLRDLEAAGDDARPHLVIQGMDEGAHLVAPSVLVKEMEVLKPGKEREKPPFLPNPFFGQ
jgi:predicted Zn-dependent protease